MAASHSFIKKRLIWARLAEPTTINGTRWSTGTGLSFRLSDGALLQARTLPGQTVDGKLYERSTLLRFDGEAKVKEAIGSDQPAYYWESMPPL